MAQQYKYTFVRKLGNKLITAALKLGIGPAKTYLLTVMGRKTARQYTTPVNLVEREGVEYLVAPYGEVSWVKNARAAGEVGLRRGRRMRIHRIVELAPSDALPMLEDYWRGNTITRPYFYGTPGDETFAQDTRRHPVFRLT